MDEQPQQPLISDPIRWFTAAVALLILIGTYYALVLYPFVLDSDVKLWLTGLSGTAALYLFGDQLQRSSARAAVKAYEKGLQTPAPTPATPTPVEITQPVEVAPAGSDPVLASLVGEPPKEK